MAMVSFVITGSYRPEGDEFFVFPFEDKSTPMFDRTGVPSGLLTHVSVSRDRGGRTTFFSGIVDGRRMVADSIRLDAEDVEIREQLKSAVAVSIEKARNEFHMSRVIVFMDKISSGLVAAVQEGAVAGGYRFDRYLEKKADDVNVELVISSGAEAFEEVVRKNGTVISWMNRARDILNEPPNMIYPDTLSGYFMENGRAAGMEMEVWDEARLEKEGCGGILAVGRGASSRPRLVCGTWEPDSASVHIALVGKGVTFDTGGYCLKPGSSQIGMKYDMGGAAMMFAAACAISELGLPVRISLFTPLVENDISSTAFHATDIITLRSGRTVQIDNTDAEGRLILADALSLAEEKKPDIIIDAATLTGACVVALGEDIAGVFSRDSELADRLVKAGLETGEWLWPMPLHAPYMEQLKAEIADCKNIGGKWGGAITAALFLSRFIGREQKWAHIDIAGPAVKEEPLGHLGKGAKGFGVKTIVRFVEDISAR